MDTQTLHQVAYTNWTNLDARFSEHYQPGHRLVRGWVGTLEVTDPTALEEIAERLFRIHNRDDRPDRYLCPSMSVGDVVVIGEVAISVAGRGWEIVRLDPSDLITDRTWSQCW